MNQKTTKLEITQKLDELLSAIEKLLKAESDTGFFTELSKHKLIQLYDSICSYNRSTIDNQNRADASLAIQDEMKIPKQKRQKEESLASQENTQSAVKTIKSEAIEKQPQTEKISQIVLSEPDTETSGESSKPFSNEMTIVIPATKIEENDSVVQKQSVDNIKQQEQQSENQSQIISDKFKKECTTVFEKFSSGKESKSIGTQLQSTPLNDLKKSIGINDRFSFINELFSGSKTKYDNFIEAIIKAQTSEDIINMLEQYSTELSWKSKTSFGKFSEMIKRYSLSK